MEPGVHIFDFQNIFAGGILRCLHFGSFHSYACTSLISQLRVKRVSEAVSQQIEAEYG